jgi:hypothetical protein
VKPFVYCDHNFVVVAHDEGAAYHAKLRQLVADGKVRFVLSTWHWLEMARDDDRARGLSVAAFADSLSPAWLFERLTVQQWEVEEAFFRFKGDAFQRPSRIGHLADVIADLVKVDKHYAGAHRDSRAFVAHMQTLGEDHPVNASIRANFEKQKWNGEAYRAGKIRPEMLQRLDRLLIGRFLPTVTPNGEQITLADKDRFLQACKINDFPSTAVEGALSLDGWKTGRVLTDRAFRDSQHIVALPYVDLFVTNDGQMANAIRRIVGQFTFRTAEVISKAEFDKRFLP